MRHIPFRVFLLTGFLLAGSAFSQIALQLQSTQARYMRFEPIEVLLTVTNLSGNTLSFSGDREEEQGSIAFRIENASGGKRPQVLRGMGNPAKGLKLSPGESKTLSVLVNQYFTMQREGSYSITAYLDHNRLPRRHVSDPIRVEIMDTRTVLTKNIGLPTDRKTGLIKTIQLSLLRFSDTSEDIYALRAEDEQNVYAVFRLETYIDGVKPQMELDDNSLVHLLLQVQPRLYAYYIFGFEGRNMRMRQCRFYVSADGIPPCLNRETGYLRIVHGKLAREGIDYIDKNKLEAAAENAANAEEEDDEETEE